MFVAVTRDYGSDKDYEWTKMIHLQRVRMIGTIYVFFLFFFFFFLGLLPLIFDRKIEPTLFLTYETIILDLGIFISGD